MKSFSIFAAAGIAATIAFSAPAFAEQGNMERAIMKLNEAKIALRQAPPNKGGHKERAMELIDKAINQVQEGIIWADQHR
jgi:hypothetical protein